jgi:ABC-type uncharacterized transport system fused permease/ATPase subunit
VRALIVKPDVLLLDEAVTTLDDEDGRELYRMLGRRLPDAIVISTGRSAALGAVHRSEIGMSGSSAAARQGVAFAVPA